MMGILLISSHWYLTSCWASGLPLLTWRLRSLRGSWICCPLEDVVGTITMWSIFLAMALPSESFILWFLFMVLEMWVWRSFCRQRMRAKDLYVMFCEITAWRLDIAWIWRIGVHLKINMFLWKLAWGHLPTKSILNDRGVPLPSACPYCEYEQETVDHAIFWYPRAAWIWRMANLLSIINLMNNPTQLFLESRSLAWIQKWPWLRVCEWHI